MGNSLPQLPTLVMWERVLRIRRYLHARESEAGETLDPPAALDNPPAEINEEQLEGISNLERLSEVLRALANGDLIDDEQVLWQKWGDGDDPFNDWTKDTRR